MICSCPIIKLARQDKYIINFPSLYQTFARTIRFNWDNLFLDLMTNTIASLRMVLIAKKLMLRHTVDSLFIYNTFVYFLIYMSFGSHRPPPNPPSLSFKIKLILT